MELLEQDAPLGETERQLVAVAQSVPRPLVGPRIWLANSSSPTAVLEAAVEKCIEGSSIESSDCYLLETDDLSLAEYLCLELRRGFCKFAGVLVSPSANRSIAVGIGFYGWLPSLHARAQESEIRRAGRATAVLRDAADSRGVAPTPCVVMLRSLFPEAKFTAKQAETLLLLARGLSDSEMEQELELSRSSVRCRLRSTLAKLGVSSRREFLGLLWERGFELPRR